MLTAGSGRTTQATGEVCPHCGKVSKKRTTGACYRGLTAILLRRTLSLCASCFQEDQSWAILPSIGPERPPIWEVSAKHKIALGVARKTCFYSFRHAVRTILTNTGAELRDAWIDAVFGHAANEQGSEGARIYTKRIYPKWFKKVVDAIEPEVDLSHLRGL